MARFSPTVIDHFSNPRNCGRLGRPDVSAFVGNPVCGDQILLTAYVRDAVITEVSFEAFGCSPALAVASILTDRLAGMTLSEIGGLDATRVLDWSGGLSPGQRHVAELGADVARRLVENFRSGRSDEEMHCGG